MKINENKKNLNFIELYSIYLILWKRMPWIEICYFWIIFLSVNRTQTFYSHENIDTPIPGWIEFYLLENNFRYILVLIVSKIIMIMSMNFENYEITNSEKSPI